MGLIDKISVGLKAVFQLGCFQVWKYINYQIGLRSGYLRFRTPTSSINRLLPDYVFKQNWFFPLPPKSELEKFGINYLNRILRTGDEISNGMARLFGGKSVPLKLAPEGKISHWTFHETGKASSSLEDIKFIWEAARFGWAIELGKAYFIAGDEKYSLSFIHYLKEFRKCNPLNTGPNWQSGQEVALRLIALVISLHLFRKSKNLKPWEKKEISIAIADHAERILPTLNYAIAQNNNHLISEAVGLYTAGLFLAEHPRSKKWKSTGRRLFNQAIQGQIDNDGEYCQHSTNYHRMVLVLALWMRTLLRAEKKDFNLIENQKIAAATGWLIGQFDAISGKATNLGHNDGAFILPFSNGEFSDYRPIIQAASSAFLGKHILPDGFWNDLGIWFNLSRNKNSNKEDELFRYWPETRIGNQKSWANLRTSRYTNRPAHADQLHVDLWVNGINILRDAGTYLYNAPLPWENALASTIVHNTVSIDGKGHMTKAGRFLWLDWAQGKILDSSNYSIKAEHSGFQKNGLIHQRELKKISDSKWEVNDLVKRINSGIEKNIVQIHWLLPDWQYDIQGHEVGISAPFGKMKIRFHTNNLKASLLVSVIRAGEAEVGQSYSPNLGWYSPTYGELEPALSLICQIDTVFPIETATEISFMS